MSTSAAARQHLGNTSSLRTVYGLPRLILLTLAAIGAAVLIAGFWNYHLVDGFGRDVIAGSTIGDTSAIAGTFAERGSGFGFVFAAVAGLAATFTACNCVVFAVLPGLACSTRQAESTVRPLSVLWAFVGGVLIVSAGYGFFVGALGPEGVAAYNQRPVRLAQAQAIFTLLGGVMLLWGALELGFLDAVKHRVSDGARAFWDAATTKAAAIGLLVGFFAVGRPFPVFREFLTYAANAQSPLYGAGVMMVQGLGQVAVMVLLFVLLISVGRSRITQWAREKPHEPRLVGGLALVGGGAFFVFYWGLAFAYDIGQWGFKLGWYG